MKTEKLGKVCGINKNNRIKSILKSDWINRKNQMDIALEKMHWLIIV